MDNDQRPQGIHRLHHRYTIECAMRMLTIKWMHIGFLNFGATARLGDHPEYCTLFFSRCLTILVGHDTPPFG